MYNQSWVKKRLDAIIAFYGADFFRNKKILDIGAGYGEFAVALVNMGAHVTCVDVRKENIDKIRIQNSAIRCVVADLEHEWPFHGEYFDLILHLSTLDHMANIEQHLAEVLISSNYLVLDTQVCDSMDPFRVSLVKENKLNTFHSFNGVGCRPSIGYIENLLNKNGLIHECIMDSRCNSREFSYDWLCRDTGAIRDGLSRMWFAKRYSIREIDHIPGQHVRPQEQFVLTALPSAHLPRVPEEKRTLPEQKAPPLETIARSQPQHLFKSPPAQAIQAPPPGPKPYVTSKQRVRLYYNYYVDKDPARMAEIELCLQRNIENSYFELIIIDSEQPPTYNFFFEKINRLSGPDDINIICNTDIFFDQSITHLKAMPHHTLYALTRWEWHPTRALEFQEESNKYDVLIVRGPVRGVNGDFKISKPNSAARIAFEFEKAKYFVLNPSRSIKTYHYHDSGIRNPVDSVPLEGETLSIRPTGL